MTQTWRWLLAPALLIALVSGCRRAPVPEGPTPPAGPPPSAAEPLRIGAIFPLSGGAGRIGEMKRQGADLAVQHLNAAGGVHGRPLEIVYADSKNQATEAGAAFAKLVDVERVPVVMSAMSQVSLALAAPADRQQVVLFANASHPALPGKSPFVFRNLPSTKLGAPLLAETAWRDLGLRRVAVLHINDEYGAEARKLFEEKFRSLGGQVVGSQTFEVSSTDLRAALGSLARQRPDGWYIPGYGAALGLALKQKRELKLPGLVLCDLGLVDANVLKSAGPAADRVVVAAPDFDPASTREAVQRFVRGFEQAYQESPSFDAAFQYDAVFLIADALKRAKEPSGDAIRVALAATSDFVGVCGPTKFDTQGDADLTMVVRMMLDGKLTSLEALPTAPVPAKPVGKAPSKPSDETGGE
ncbi:MAG: ABC transporter substrate-binding protein [Fimbriimonadaceae bacterium]|nr:ABC transporter substrate-binding protein [Fimbriimonadaceae bacterium]